MIGNNSPTKFLTNDFVTAGSHQVGVISSSSTSCSVAECSVVKMSADCSGVSQRLHEGFTRIGNTEVLPASTLLHRQTSQNTFKVGKRPPLSSSLSDYEL